MAFYANKLKILRIERGLTQRELAEKIGVGKSAIGMYESGKRTPEFETLEAICDFFNVNMDVLSDLKNSAPAANKTLHATHRIPVLGRVAAGTPIEACEDILDYVYMDKKYENDGYKYFALKIQGHSMEPTIMDGDTVIVRQQDTIETGQIAIVLVDGEDATAKEVKEAPEGITLIGHNAAVYTPHFYSNEDIETLPLRVLGRVIEVRRDV